MDTDRMQKSRGSVSGESSARDNIRHIWKCNQELLRYADDHLDAYVKRLSASGSPASSIDIAEKLGFRGKLRTRTVEVYRFALLETGRYPYTLTQGIKKKFGEVLRPITDFEPTGYIDLTGMTYLQCRFIPEGSNEGTTVYVQVDRETAIGFLFKILSLPIKEDPTSSAEATDRKLEEGKKAIKEYLDHMPA